MEHRAHADRLAARNREVILRIEWVDSHSFADGPWHFVEDVELMQISTCISVGKLVKESDDMLVIAGSWTRDQYDGVMAIPKVSITQKRELK
jgi:hypothetical protein